MIVRWLSLGMDPAGPFFEGYDNRVRLNPTDAKFVDVIHSNAKPMTQGGAGMYAACGHVDFYPNGGREQPGCPNQISGVFKKILSLDFGGIPFLSLPYCQERGRGEKGGEGREMRGKERGGGERDR